MIWRAGISLLYLLQATTLSCKKNETYQHHIISILAFMPLKNTKLNNGNATHVINSSVLTVFQHFMAHLPFILPHNLLLIKRECRSNNVRCLRPLTVHAVNYVVNVHINIPHRPLVWNDSFPSRCLLHMIAVVTKPIHEFSWSLIHCPPSSATVQPPFWCCISFRFFLWDACSHYCFRKSVNTLSYVRHVKPEH